MNASPPVVALPERARVYRSSPWLLWLVGGIAAALMLVPLAVVIYGLAIGDSPTAAIGGIIAVLLLPAFLILAWACWFPRLMISETGVSLRGPFGFATITVPWQNIAGILWRPNREGFVCREPLACRPAQKFKNWRFATVRGVPLYDEQQRELIGQQRYLPLQNFSYWIKRGDLLVEISRYAPWIAEDVAQQATSFELESKENRKVVIIVLTVLGLVVATALLAGLYDVRVPDDWQAALDRWSGPLLKIAAGVIALGTIAYAAMNVRSSWRFLRAKQYGASVLWAVFAVVQALLVLAVLGTMR